MNATPITQSFPTTVGWFSVKDYGAIGDGTTDDTSAIQQAINAAVAANGGTVWFPHGTYRVTATLTLGAHLRLAGEGAASIISYQPLSGTTLFSQGDVDMLWVESLYLLGPGTANSIAFTLTGSTNVYLRWVVMNLFGGLLSASSVIGLFVSDCAATFSANATVDGVILTGSTGKPTLEAHFTNVVFGGQQQPSQYSLQAAFHLQYCGGVWMTQCDMFGFSVGLSITPLYGQHVGECFFTQCDFDDATNNSIGISPASGAQVFNLVFVGGRAACLGSDDSVRINVNAGSYISGISILGMGMQLGHAGLGVFGAGGTFDGMTIIGSLITGNSVTGITLGSVSNVRIEGCDFRPVAGYYSAQPYAVQLNNVSNVHISDCDVQGQSTAPFELTGTNQSVAIRNCFGYNPVASVVAPALTPNTNFVNNGPTDVTVYVSGGSVQSIKVGGMATGLTSGTFKLAVGMYINIAYTATPTWMWIGE